MNRTVALAVLAFVACLVPALVGCGSVTEQPETRPVAASPEPEDQAQEAADSEEARRQQDVSDAVEALAGGIDWQHALSKATVSFPQNYGARRGESDSLRIKGGPVFAAPDPAVDSGVSNVQKRYSKELNGLDDDFVFTKMYLVAMTVETEPEDWKGNEPAPTSVTLYVPMYQSQTEEPAGTVHHEGRQGPYGGLWNGLNLVSIGGGYYLELDHARMAKASDPNKTWDQTLVKGTRYFDEQGKREEDPHFSLFDIDIEKLVR